MGSSVVKLELTVDEVNVILLSLAEQPYKEVFQLIGKVKAQADPQVSDTIS